MSTLRRDLRMKFLEILSAYLDQVVIPESDANKMVDELADEAIKIFTKPKFDLKGAGLDWQVLAGEEISQESLDANILAKEARDAFEVAFGFNPPWFQNKDWTDFADFVAKVYKDDKATRSQPGNVWSDYCFWREQGTGGKYGKAMQNVGIRKNPKQFMDTAMPTFLAASVMYPIKTPTQPRLIETDDSDAPVTY